MTYLQSQGFRLIRLWNHDILARPDEVVDAIWTALPATSETP